MNQTFTPGTLITARGREWIVQPPEPDFPETILRLRPLSGTSEDEFLLDMALEKDVGPASFPPPDPEKAGTFRQAILLRDALRLSLRAGAGPFRSFGNLAFAPRAYQLVPLMMALKQRTVRLLIADDVGVGKTIESGLILRELLDRGEVERACVLCPPPLVDQWVSELARHFHIEAKAVTSSSAAKLERQIPDANLTIFEYYPFTVVSLDYIKNDQHVATFLQTAPEFVIVDEAHTCTQLGSGRQRRWQLVKQLSENANRHMVFTTATPHSGSAVGFGNLLSLLRPEFVTLAESKDADEAHRALRQQLGEYFVQRRRADLAEWRDDKSFPQREIAESTYRLTGPWSEFFEHVLEFCRGLLKGHNSDSYQDYIYWYATLGLLRCASSSPAAAVQALANRLETANEEELPEGVRVADFDEAEASDITPGVVLERNKALQKLREEAEALLASGDDPKLTALVKLLKNELLKGSRPFRPIIFCRFIETAKYVAEKLKTVFKDYTVVSVTGNDDAEARAATVEDAAENPKHILVATDCLAEGINLQHDYDAVVHYDLLWNPTRHQQREGRVDRFGQKSPCVRCALMYGQDNPVDGLVLRVISKKAKTISDSLGVSVTVPVDDRRVSLAIMQAALFKKNKKDDGQLMLFTEEELNVGYAALKKLDELEADWQNAAEQEKKSKTIFAQRSIHPKDVMSEWERIESAFGSHEDILDFVKGTLAETGERSLPDGIDPDDLTRSHPYVAELAKRVLENAIDDSEGTKIASRCAAAVSPDVKSLTRIFLLRLRHKLDVRNQALIVEETAALAVEGVANPVWIQDDATISKLLKFRPSQNLTGEAVRRQVAKALEFAAANREVFDGFAKDRAETLLADHRRVRDAAGAKGSFAVQPILPADVMGVFVLIPDEV